MAGIRKETMPTLSEHKICCHCKEAKTLDCFNNDKGKPDGKALTCKECRSKQRKELRSINPQKYDEAAKKWRMNNKDRYAEWAFQSRHGISRQEVIELVEKQNGCAICGTKFPLGDGRWHVDHDHSCCNKGSCPNCRRSVLCNFCNSMIGYARENTDVLSNAIDYLNRHRKGQDAYIV